jgi:hypothetical protein
MHNEVVVLSVVTLTAQLGLNPWFFKRKEKKKGITKVPKCEIVAI